MTSPSDTHNPITCAALSCAECDSADVVTVPDALEAAEMLRARAERAEAERDAYKRDLDAEARRNFAIRRACGARANETLFGFVTRMVAERNDARAQIDVHTGKIAGLRFRLAEVEAERDDFEQRSFDAEWWERDAVEEIDRLLAEITRITAERAKLVAEIERMRAERGGDHYALALDVVRAAQAWLDADVADDAAAEYALESAVLAYERGEVGDEAGE